MKAYRLRDWLIHHKRLTLLQTGLPIGRRTVDNISIIKICVYKYLQAKTGRLYWCFVNFEKVFDAINREASQFKMIKHCVKYISSVQSKQKGFVKVVV
jgi:hypothetical protein